MKVVLAFSILAGLLLQPSLATAHRGHQEVPVTLSTETWAQHLVNFRKFGEVHDLDAAKTIAASIDENTLTIDQQLLAAQTAQADHRFAEAVQVLDRLIDAYPGFDGARLILVNTLVTMGRRDEGHKHCSRFEKMPISVALACRLMSSGDVMTYRQLRGVVGVEELRKHPQLRGWVLAVLGDHEMTREDFVSAERHYRRAYEADPVIGYQITRVEALLREARFEEAISAAIAFDHNLAMQVKIAIASRNLGSSNRALERMLSELFEHDLNRSDYTHGREMAEFYLFVAKDSARAANVLKASLHTQRTPEDLRLWRLAIGQ